MKTLLLSMAAVLFSISVSAQSPAMGVGTIEYYEGKVMVGNGTEWTQAKIGATVLKTQYIRTASDALAEITWNNNVTSVVGPNSNLLISSLMDGSNSDAKSETESSFDNFKRIFGESEAATRTQEGGIRRAETEIRTKPAKDEMYWKSEQEVYFEEAYGLYQGEQYTKAIKSLQTFINQKPNDPDVKYAFFALGHSYIMSNNNVKAKEIFEKFIVSFSDDELTPVAKSIIAEL